MPKTKTAETTPDSRPLSVHVHLDEHHDALLEQLCARPGHPRITKAEAMRWSLRENAKREGVTAVAEENAA